MSRLDVLGPIVNEPRKKYRITYAPNVERVRFGKVMVWDKGTGYYVPIANDVCIPEGEVIDHFITVDEYGEPLHLFARQLDDKVFILKQEIVDGATKEPGKGNNQDFWLQEI